MDDNKLMGRLAESFMEAFSMEYYSIKGELPELDEDFGQVPRGEFGQVGGYAWRDPYAVKTSWISSIYLRSVAYQAGREAARYLLGAEPLGTKDYKQGVLGLICDVDPVPMPKNFDPKRLRCIIKCMGEAGIADPRDQTLTIGWKCDCRVNSWKATAIEKGPNDDYKVVIEHAAESGGADTKGDI